MFSIINITRSVWQSSFHNSVFTRYSLCFRGETSAAVDTTVLKYFVVPFDKTARSYWTSSSLACQRRNKMSLPSDSKADIPRPIITQTSDGFKTKSNLETASKAALQIFNHAVESVKPGTLLRNTMSLSPDHVLEIEARDEKISLNLKEYQNIFVVGFGKAVLPMAEEVMKLLENERVKKCFVNIPEGFRDSTNPAIEINRGAKNNIPDEAAFLGSQRIVDIVKSAGPKDLLLVLITGGGSALLPYPTPPLTIEEKSKIVKKLSIKGATIQQLNTVRKRLSLVKGGGLTRLAGCNRIVSLILSDVLGDPLDVIASGPTVPNPDPQDLAWKIVDEYLPAAHIPDSARNILNETTQDTSSSTKTVSNLIIGNNSVALNKAAEVAEWLNLTPLIITNTLSGEASEVGRLLANLAIGTAVAVHTHSHWSLKAAEVAARKLLIEKEMVSKIMSVIEDKDSFAASKGLCFLLGGETTVNVKGRGVGGRNQELVLRAAAQLDGSVNNENVFEKVAILSGGTDGFDGPCDAAGALCEPTTIKHGIKSAGLDAFDFLIRNDSYNYFSKNCKGKYHIKTGHTETNVMDIVVLIVLKK